MEGQKAPAGMGCFVKTLFGIHDGAPEAVTSTGLINHELIGDDGPKGDVMVQLERFPGISVEPIEMSL